MSDRMPNAVAALDVPPRTKPSGYPEPFHDSMVNTQKSALGDFFGLENFGVNITRIAPGGISALMHAHSLQDELIHVLEGSPTLVTPSGETPLLPGMCAGFPAGGEAHHIVNRTRSDVVILEIGDRSAGDEVFYPRDDIRAVAGADGRRRFIRKDGTAY